MTGLPEAIEDAIANYGDAMFMGSLSEAEERYKDVYDAIAAATVSDEEREAIQAMANLALVERLPVATPHFYELLSESQSPVNAIPLETLKRLAGGEGV